MRKVRAGSVISHGYLILLTFVSIFPSALDLISSVKGKGELYRQSHRILAQDVDAGLLYPCN